MRNSRRHRAVCGLCRFSKCSRCDPVDPCGLFCQPEGFGQATCWESVSSTELGQQATSRKSAQLVPRNTLSLGLLLMARQGAGRTGQQKIVPFKVTQTPSSHRTPPPVWLSCLFCQLPVALHVHRHPDSNSLAAMERLNNMLTTNVPTLQHCRKQALRVEESA